MFNALCFVALVFAVGANAESRIGIGSPSVSLPTGTIYGADIRDREYDIDVERFLGIPYAEPPVGDLRFKKPLAYVGSSSNEIDGTLDFTAYDHLKCIQPDQNNADQTIGQEDCLYLNVWVPGGVKAAKQEALPVLVFMHGGMNVYGSSFGPIVHDERVHDMQKIAVHGHFIAVSINYRLGPMGFLSTLDENAPGNAALYDQNLALKWIQQHIWAFGGNPNMVTIFGQGAGGVLASMQAMSTLSSTMFNRVIAESGNALAPYAINPDPVSTAFELGSAVGCTSLTTSSLVSCLKTVPAAQLTLGITSFATGVDALLTPKWAAVVDGTFLTDVPLNLMSSMANKDLLVGNNDMDSHKFVLLDYPNLDDQIFTMNHNDLVDVSQSLNPNTPESVSKSIVYEYTNYYGGIIFDYTETIVKLYNDYLFLYPSYAIASRHETVAATTGKNTFAYIYDVPSEVSISGGYQPLWLGADHMDELPYVFDVPGRASLYYSSEEQSLSKSMMTYWSNFVWSGNPNTGYSTYTLPLYWQPYEKNTEVWLDLNTRLIENPTTSYYTAYRDLYPAYWTRIVPQLLGTAAQQCETETPEAPAPTAMRKKNYVGEKQTRDIATACGTSDDWVRETSTGCIRGDFSTYNGYTVGRYRGVRYGAEQTNATRFLKPSPAPYVTGISDATSFSKICPQTPYNSMTMAEDCLFLNVYVPTDASVPNNQVQSGKYATMVWFYDSEFMHGSANDWDGTIMAATQNIIVVTVNYRLGSLGFLSTGGKAARGDWALWDQYLALEWVDRNIENFSGDRDRITIAGSGTGSEMAHLHTLSEVTQGLKMTQAILQSGTAFTLNSYPEQSNQAFQLASRVGCAEPSPAPIGTDLSLDCLRSVSIEELMLAQQGNKALEPLQFAAVIDGDFIVLDPLIDIDIPSIRSWRYIMGFNDADGTYHWDTISGASDGSDYSSIIKSDFRSQYGVATDDIDFQYHTWSNPGFEINADNVQQSLVKAFTDYKFTSPTTELAYTATTTSILPTSVFTDVWMYHLTLPYLDAKQNSLPAWTGTRHGADAEYVFGAPLINDGGDPNSAQLSQTMMTYWANFVKDGSPNGDTVNKWSRYQDRQPDYITFSANSDMDANLLPQEVLFWGQVLPTMNVTCGTPF